MFTAVLATLLFVGAAAIALALIYTITTKQKSLIVVPRSTTDSENLVSFFTHAAYNKQKNRKRFFRLPLRAGKNSIVSTLPKIVDITELSEVVTPCRVEIDDALTKPSPHQWRDMQSYARKTMAPLLVSTTTSKVSSSEVVICLNIHDELPHFEFFRVAISKCSRHVDKISIVVYNCLSRDRDITIEQMLASALAKYLSEFKCTVETGASKSNFNLIRNAMSVIVLPHDAFGLMACISGYNTNVVKLASSQREDISAWPSNFLLLRDFAVVDRKTCENTYEWIKKLSASRRSALQPKELNFMEKIVVKMGKDVTQARLQRNCAAPRPRDCAKFLINA
jgi:hypothetical protein